MAVVGGLASAAQLIDLSTNIVVSLISIYRKAQEAPSRILQYIREVEGLIVTTKFIEDQSDIHQNRVVQSSIQATLVEARELKVVLDRVATDYTKGSTRRKYWKRIKASKESNIRIQFKRLESAKIQLVLCISAQSISTLCAIQSKIDRLLVEFDRQKTFDVSLSIYDYGENRIVIEAKTQMLSRKTKSSASTKTKTSQTTEHGSKENNKHGAFQRMLTRLSGSRSERHTPVENQSQALVVMERQEATQGLHKEDPRSAAAEVATIISPLDSRPSGAASVEDGYAQGIYEKFLNLLPLKVLITNFV